MDSVCSLQKANNLNIVTVTGTRYRSTSKPPLMHSRELCTVGILLSVNWYPEGPNFFSCYGCERCNGKFLPLFTFFLFYFPHPCIERLCVPNGDDGTRTGVRVQCGRGAIYHVRGSDLETASWAQMR